MPPKQVPELPHSKHRHTPSPDRYDKDITQRARDASEKRRVRGRETNNGSPFLSAKATIYEVRCTFIFAVS